MFPVDEIKEIFSFFFPGKIPEASVEFAEGVIDNLSGMGGWGPPNTESYRGFVRFYLEVPNITICVERDGTVLAEWLEKPGGIDPDLWSDIKRSLGYAYRSVAFSDLNGVKPEEIAKELFEAWQIWQKVKEQIIARAKQLRKEKEALDWSALQDIRRIIGDAHHH